MMKDSCSNDDNPFEGADCNNGAETVINTRPPSLLSNEEKAS